MQGPRRDAPWPLAASVLQLLPQSLPRPAKGATVWLCMPVVVSRNRCAIVTVGLHGRLQTTHEHAQRNVRVLPDECCVNPLWLRLGAAPLLQFAMFEARVQGNLVPAPGAATQRPQRPRRLTSAQDSELETATTIRCREPISAPTQTCAGEQRLMCNAPFLSTPMH